jgi:hypothetical protein
MKERSARGRSGDLAVRVLAGRLTMKDANFIFGATGKSRCNNHYEL